MEAWNNALLGGQHLQAQPIESTHWVCNDFRGEKMIFCQKKNLDQMDDSRGEENVIFSQKKISRPIELHIKPTSLRRWNLFEMGLVHIIHFQTCKITCQLFIYLHLLGLLGLHFLCKLSISNHWGFHINFSSNCISMAWGLHPPLKLSISNHWGFHITFHLFTFRWPLRLN